MSSSPSRSPRRLLSGGAVFVAVLSSFLALSLSLTLSPSALAQSITSREFEENLPGFRANAVYDVNGPDFVDLYSGSTGLAIPLSQSYALSSGLSFALRLVNGTKIWNMGQDPCIGDPNGQPKGWGYVQGLSAVGAGFSLSPGYADTLSITRPDGGTIHLEPGPVGDPDLYASDTSRVRVKKIGGTPSFPDEIQMQSPEGEIYRFTQKFQRPLSNDPSKFPDFRDEKPTEAAKWRWGLTEIKDRYGRTVLTVTYDPVDAWKFKQINLLLDGGTKTITFWWTTYAVTSAIPTYGISAVWPVISSIDLPSTGGVTQSVTFQYKDGVFTRNVGVGTPYCPEPNPTVFVPELEKITFSAPGATNTVYTFEYNPAVGEEPPGSGYAAGLVTAVTLPTGGRIEYTYSATASPGNAGPDGTSANPAGGAPPLPSFWPTEWEAAGAVIEDMPGVYKRRAYDPVTGITSDTFYRRKHVTAGLATQDSLVFRRVDVDEPSGNGGRRSRYHYFSSFGASQGLEVMRKHYDTNIVDATTPVLRTLVKCYDGDDRSMGIVRAQCGFKYGPENYKLVKYGFGKKVRLQKELTVYGKAAWSVLDTATSLYQVDADCSHDRTKACYQRTLTTWNTTAEEYEVETVSVDRTPPSGGGSNPSIYLVEDEFVKRETTTGYTPYVTSSVWLPRRIYSKTTQDTYTCGPNYACLPQRTCPNEPCITQETYAYFDGARPAFLSQAQQTTPSYEPASSLTRSYSSDAYGNPQIETVGGLGLVEGGNTFQTNRTFQNGRVLTTQRQGLTAVWNSFDVTRDPATGLVTSSRDPNLLQTTYAYDGHSRLTSISPPGESSTTICYQNYASPSSPARVIVKKGVAGACTTTLSSLPVAGTGTVEAYSYDGFGRLLREIKLLPNALSTGSPFALRETKYNDAGQQTWKSEWTPCNFGANGLDLLSCLTTVTTKGTSSANFDFLGRPKLVTGADGYRTKLSYDDPTGGVPNSDGAEVRWQERSLNLYYLTAQRKDPFGKLFVVSDPEPDTPPSSPEAPAAEFSKTANQSLDAAYAHLTSYFWNAAGKLGRVIQTRSGVTQNRTFTYSALGLLKQECHPERNCTNYSLYDALGNPRIKDDAGITVTTTYDKAGRSLLVTATEPPNPTKTYLENQYDVFIPDGQLADEPPITGAIRAAGGLYPKGRLVRQIAYNPGAVTDYRVFDDYVYSGPGGRLSTRDTLIKHPDTTWKLRGTRTYTYNALGLLDTLTHPRWGEAPFSETTTYKAGHPTSILANGTSVLVAANYNPSGGLLSYATGNGVVTTLQQDVNLLPRPARIYTAGASANFDTGVYQYDGEGNVTAMGSDSFQYDEHSRLVFSRVWDLGSYYDDTWSYDGFHNLTSHQVFTNNVLGGTYGFTTSLATNRLGGSLASYDARGNMLTYTDPWTPYGTDILTYDTLSRQIAYSKSVGASQEEYLFEGTGERLVRVGAVVSPLQILTTSLPRGQAGVSYNVQLTATGGTAPYTWSLYSGTLPTGLTLNSAGVLSGIPTKSGSFLITVRVQDAAGAAQMAYQTYTLTIVDGLKYYTVAPCRLYDSRFAGAGQPLASGEVRTIVAAGTCGIPSNAKLLSANLTTTQWATPTPKQRRLVYLYPAGLTVPAPAPISGTVWAYGDRATMAMPNVSGPTSGAFTVSSDLTAGESVHFIVDVSGYFAPTGPYTEREPATATATVPANGNATATDKSGQFNLFSLPASTPSPLATDGVWYATHRNEAKKPLTDYENTTAAKDYVYLGHLLIATYEGNSATPGWKYYSSDHLGTPRLVTGDGGAVLEARKYRPYGLALNVFNPPQRGFGFAGMEREASNTAAQSFYDHARNVSSWTGRFNAVDAAGGKPEDPASWNRYAYAKNNPLKYVDPDGKAVQVAAAPVAIELIGGAVITYFIVEAAVQLATGQSIQSYMTPQNLRFYAEAGKMPRPHQAEGAQEENSPPPGEATGQSEAPGFVVTPNGEVIPVPEGAAGPAKPEKGEGQVYQGGSGGREMDKKTTGVRIMDGNSKQGPRANYMNKNGQTVDPKTGRTIPNDDPRGHLPLKPPPPRG